jgi:hypothetical protein
VYNAAPFIYPRGKAMKVTLCAAIIVLASGWAWGQPQNNSSAPLQAPPRLPAMSRWSDPTERAFSVNVPAGWRIAGGTHRIAPIDARSYVTAESPDGKIRVFVNDPDVLPRQEPHPLYVRQGYIEGREVNGPSGPLFVERFKSGAQFAQEFTTQKMCSRAMPVASFDLRQETQRMNQEIAQAAVRVGAHVQSSAGEYLYRCGEQSGYTLSVTVDAFINPQGPHTWSIEKLNGYVSDLGEVDVARYVMNAMVSSFQIDPAWQAQYERQIQDTTGALMDISNRITQASMQAAQQSMQQNMKMVQQRQQQFDQINQMRQSSFQRQQDAQTKEANNWSNIILGQEHGCDDLGRCSTIPNDAPYNWSTPSGNVVPGPSDGSPPSPEDRPWKPD